MSRKIKYATADFDVASLPTNRKNVFQDILKQRFDLILKMGLVMLVVFIPLLSLLLACDWVILNARLDNDPSSSVDTEEVIYLMTILKSIAIVITSPIVAVGVSMILEVLKKVIWYEPVHFLYDCIQGIKKHYKSVVFVTVIITLLLTTSQILTHIDVKGLMLQMLKYIPYGLVMITGIPVYLIVIVQITVYEDQLVTHLKNAFILYLVAFVRFGRVALGLFIPMWIYPLLPSMIISYGVLILGLWMYLPIWLLVWVLQSFSIFDEYINQKQFPLLFRKGLQTTESVVKENTNHEN